MALNLALVSAGAVVVLQEAALVRGAADSGVAVAADYPVAGLVSGALVIGPFRDQTAAAFGAEGSHVVIALDLCVALDQSVSACVPCVHVPTPNKSAAVQISPLACCCTDGYDDIAAPRNKRASSARRIRNVSPRIILPKS